MFVNIWEAVLHGVLIGGAVGLIIGVPILLVFSIGCGLYYLWDQRWGR